VAEKYIVLVFYGWGYVVVAEIYILLVSGAVVLWLVYIVLVVCGWGSVVVAEIYILFVSGAGVLWLVWLWLGCLIVHF
jgi:hypothetical protein